MSDELITRLEEYIDDHCDCNLELRKLLQECILVKKENDELAYYIKACLTSYDCLDLEKTDINQELYLSQCMQVLTDIDFYLNDADSMIVANSLIRSLRI